MTTMEAKELFFIVLAFCVLWLTVFMCWGIYQFSVFVKRANDLLAELRHQVERVERAINGVKSKFDAGTMHLGSLVDHFKKTMKK
jgi:hypothetical protein